MGRVTVGHQELYSVHDKKRMEDRRRSCVQFIKDAHDETKEETKGMHIAHITADSLVCIFVINT